MIRGRRHESAVTRLRDALVARVRRDGDESGVALLSALIFMIIMAGISVVLLSTVLSQIVPSIAAQRNTRTIYAAQAGVQASLAMLRSAAAAPDSSGNVFGSTSQLKCSLSGRVDAQDNGLSYSAEISYFTEDPASIPEPTPLGCGPAGVSGQPKFAKIKSEGVAAPGTGAGTTVSGGRYLSAVYAFKVSNVNIAGGRIYDGDNALCLEAVPRSSGGVGPGSFIKFVSASACTSSPTNDAVQLWIYDTDYEIKLASSTVPPETSLCITGPATADGDTQDATLQECKPESDPDRWNQLWSWMGSYTWQGQDEHISSGYSSYYLAGPIAAGNRLQVRDGGTDGTFTPSPAVGAGAASVHTKQIVNYLEFGRCLDVTNEEITSEFMISYPCKQDPSGTGDPPGTGMLKWNHKWYYSEPTPPATSLEQTISVMVNNDPGQRYCLQTPSAKSGSVYPAFSHCDGHEDLQKWTRVNNVGSYASSYLFVDSLGRCLSVGTDPGDMFSTSFSKIVVATCDNSLAQKWNSPAAYTDSTVGGYREYTP